MEECEEAVLLRKLLGLSLKDSEAKAIVARFKEDDGQFDENRFINQLGSQLEYNASTRTASEIRPNSIIEPEDPVKWGKFSRYKALVAKKKAQQEKEKKYIDAPSATNAHIQLSGQEKKQESFFASILAHIRKGILVKLKSLPREDMLQNTFRLLSDNRSPFLTPSQLKAACLYRLNVALTDQHIEHIFDRLDPAQKGTLLIKEFVNLLLKDAFGSYEVSVVIPPSPPKVFEQANKSYVLNQSAKVSYDHKFSGLVPPEPETALYIPSLRELEGKIFDKIFERTHQGANMYQQLVRLFSDGRDKTEHHGISRDQMRFTLWKIFQLNVSNEMIEKLFKQFGADKSGFISMQKFSDAIMAIGNINEPLLEDPAVASTAKINHKRKDSDSSLGGMIDTEEVDDFLEFIRQSFQDKINREGRAPHYIINSVERMTKVRAKEYLEEKFDMTVGDTLLDALSRLYNSHHLIDMQLLLRDAIGRSEDGPKKGLLAGGTVRAEELPSSLRGIPWSPQDIERMLAQKIDERGKVGKPMSTVHKIFRLKDTDGDVRFVDRAIMRKVLGKYDIMPSDTDFERFYRKNCPRPDGMIEVRAFLTAILATGNSKLNPFLPKDAEEFQAQRNIAKVLSNMSGQMRRQVHGLNGPAFTRFVADGVAGNHAATGEARELLDLAMSKSGKGGGREEQSPMQQGQGQGQGQRTTGSRVGITPQPPSVPRPSRPQPSGTEGQKPRRPVSAPPSMQTAGQGVRRSPRAKGPQLHAARTDDVEETGGMEEMGQYGASGSGHGSGSGSRNVDGRGNGGLGEGNTHGEGGYGGSAWDDDDDDDDDSRGGDWVAGRPMSDLGSEMSKDWDRLQRLQSGGKKGPATGQSVGGRGKKGGRPYTPAANEVVAARRVPHFTKWKGTDPYQNLLKKQFKISDRAIGEAGEIDDCFDDCSFFLRVD